MNNEVIHHFCESRLQNGHPPELYNAYTSFFITIIPLLLGLPENNYFFYGASLLIFNGCASFYYHYYLNFLGKQADEISMIFATYYCIWGLLLIIFKDNITKLKYYNLLNHSWAILFIIFNTQIELDFLFPYLFGTYIVTLLGMIHKVSSMYQIPYIHNLSLSMIGAVCWIISEVECNTYTQYGHIIWHLLFPLGFYRIILDFDKIINAEIPNQILM